MDPATAAAWAAGLLAFTGVATPLWQPGQPVLLVIAIGALGGLVMAFVVAVITGVAMLRIFAGHGLPVRADRRTHL